MGNPHFSKSAEEEKSSGHGQPLFSSDAAQCHVRALMVAGPRPLHAHQSFARLALVEN